MFLCVVHRLREGSQKNLDMDRDRTIVYVVRIALVGGADFIQESVPMKYLYRECLGSF